MKKTLLLAGLLVFSLYIAAEGSVPREESAPRNFVFLFETLDYTRELGDAVSFIFNEILKPGDQLIVYSPSRVYGFSKTTLTRPKRELIAPLQEKLRGDTAQSSTSFKTIINEMRVQIQDIENLTGASSEPGISLKDILTQYRQNLDNLQALRKVNEPLLMQLLNMFKTQQGKNQIVLLYGAEYRPIPKRETINRLKEIPVIAFEVTELFSSENQKLPLDADKFIDLFTKTSITLHFIYIKLKDTAGLQNYKEHSSDMYSVFSKIAAGTGGIVETTSDPESALKSLAKALGGSEK